MRPRQLWWSTLVALAPLVLGACGGDSSSTSSSSGPSSAERAACNALEDYISAEGVVAPKVLQADLARAGRAANESGNVDLVSAIASLRESVSVYLGAVDRISAGVFSHDPAAHRAALQELMLVAQPAHDAETVARHQCATIGIAIQPSPILGGGPAP